MKKSILTPVAFLAVLSTAVAQDFSVGVHFTPLNSMYIVDETMTTNTGSSNFSNDKYKLKFDSLTIGIYAEKFFEKQHCLVRLDVNYADLNVTDKASITDVSPYFNDLDEYEQVYKQKYINISLGIGTRVNWNRLIFTFGVHVPLTIMPEGKITRTIISYSSGTLMQQTTCTGVYKPSLGIGIGSFAGINTVIFKHLSIGLEASYHIQYIKRELDWHGETQYYGYSPHISINDETYKERNSYTSKIIPSIAIAYTFNLCKNNIPK